VVFFDQNAVAGEWRAQMRCCEEQGIAVHRSIAFALAVAELLELPDALPLMPAVTAVMPVPICLGDPASLAYLKAVARAVAGNDQRASNRRSR
jgi:O-succinylbenzoate synthase